ncbi:hypothetical protein [Candidatus Hodgkinia cicadicola]
MKGRRKLRLINKQSNVVSRLVFCDKKWRYWIGLSIEYETWMLASKIRR